MNSKSQTQECFVYITLPGKVDAVTAGRFVYTLDKYRNPLGRFVYGKRYLERQDAIGIDPVDLKLSSKIYETTKLNGIFGSLRDSSPDYWGRRVIERRSGKAKLTEFDYLMFSPDDGAGALSFGLNVTPPAPKKRFNQTIELENLQRIADALIAEEEIRADSLQSQIEDLMLIGTSMGGARPKAIVEDQDGLWIAKFNRSDDRWNQARVEHAMLVLARQCGISASMSKVVGVGGRDVLLVKRFDREKMQAGYLRTRMVSALTLLRAEDNYRSRDRWSYIFLCEELRRVCANPTKEATELFRRMCFNALISNTDDHPRNHAIIAKKDNWKLSPAYDLTPSVPISIDRRDLAMICGDHGRFANAENLLSQHARFLLSADQANTILEQIETVILNSWYSIARAEGVSEMDCDKIAQAFAYPGFRSQV